MTITPDIITIVGWVAGGLGIVLLVFEIKGDRARGRLRCKRCWYDLRDTPRVDGGWTCPECGKRLVHERQLRRTRRRWKLVAIAMVLLTTPGGLYAGRVVQDHGWPSLLPDWVLVRMPIDVDWVIDDSDGITNQIWQAAIARSIEGTVRRRMDEMSDASRNTYLRRLQRAINRTPHDAADDTHQRAYDMIDLVRPTRALVDRMPRVWGTFCFGPPARVSERKRAALARQELAYGMKTLVDLLANFESIEPYAHCKTLDGLLLAGADDQGHARIERALEIIRARPQTWALPEERSLVWYDMDDMQLTSDDCATPLEGQLEEIRLLLTETVFPRLWKDNGGTDAGMALVGYSHAVVAPAEIHRKIEKLLSLMRNREGAPVTSFERGRRITIRVYDIADSVDDLMSRINREQRRTNDTNCGYTTIKEEVADAIRLHLTETVEPDAWIDNGGDDASIRYWNGIFLVRTTLDLDDRIRAELARIERGEVELDF